MSTKPISFKEFLGYFPTIELPIILSDESFDEIRKVNDDIPTALVYHFISQFDKDLDEFTEYFPCFRIPTEDDFVGLVYWKAKLLQYEFHLITYTPNGEFIAGKVIAQTLTNGESIIRSVSTIDEDLIIHVASGKMELEHKDYDAQKSKAHTLEILSTGDIVFSLNEDLYE
jgi:hypothetical protein